MEPSEVDILRAEVLWIRDVSAKVRRQSEEDLRSGVRQGNHSGLSVALQVGVQVKRSMRIELFKQGPNMVFKCFEKHET